MEHIYSTYTLRRDPVRPSLAGWLAGWLAGEVDGWEGVHAHTKSYIIDFWPKQG